MVGTLPTLAIWVLLRIVVWLGYLCLFIRRNKNYLTAPFSLAGFFLTASVMVIITFKELWPPILLHPSWTPFVIFLSAMVLNLGAHLFIPRYWPKPSQFIGRNPKEPFLALDLRHLFSKSFNILFQQCSLAALALMFQRAGFNLADITILSAVFCGLNHLVSLKNSGPFWGLFYTFFAVLSAFIFPVLILCVSYGFIYAYVIHWIFYTVSGSFFWLRYGKKENHGN